MLLASIYSRQWRSNRTLATRLYFNKNHNIVFDSNNIDFFVSFVRPVTV